MKKAYEPPKVELLEFNHTDIVCTSGPALTDNGGQISAGGWKCENRIVDVKNVSGTVCGYV